MSRLPARQVPAVHHRRFGDWLVSTVSDGYVDSPPGAIPSLSQEEVDRLMVAAQGTPAIRTSVNMFALRGHGKTYLFDAGSGTTMGPSCGRLPETLAAAGIAPEDIDAILLTHVHPDHSNGLTSDEGEALFPHAEVIVHETELSHWFDDAAMAVATERSKTRYFAAARFRPTRAASAPSATGRRSCPASPASSAPAIPPAMPPTASPAARAART